MISTMLSTASAGAFGPGSVDARPCACEAVRIALLPTAAPVQGTGLPAAGTARRRGADLVVTGLPAALPTTQFHQKHLIAQNDGTTPLGIHPPGRPQS
jgi:hypothetical protein